MNYDDLADRVVLITGGANGIGAAMVRAFHAQGSRVYFCDLDTTAARSLCAELKDEVDFHRLDLSSETQVKRWIRGIGRTTKRIDVLINNAAADPRIPLEDCSVAQWDQLFARNLRSFFLTSRESVGWMDKGASIVNFSSITVHVTPANMSAYVSTKGGILGFSRSLARELGPRRIRVNTISPGWIMTERQLKEHVTPAIKRMVRKAQCIPDLIQPSEVADIALFLASEASRAVTGQELLVDRGWAHS